jgi:predicted nucleic-acid-binding Zn-ribbon protein
MSKGQNRKCSLCGNREVEILDLITEGTHLRQILSCGHRPKIASVAPPPENLSIGESLKSTKIDHKFGQVYSDKTTESSRSIPCKNCGHTGSKHRFLKDYTGNHNCYLCDCADYEQ